MRVDAKDAKRKQLQECKKGQEGGVEDKWIRIRPLAALQGRKWRLELKQDEDE